LVPCVGGCGNLLKFHIENEIVVEGEGVIAVNFPGAVCQDCINTVLGKEADPPGLICVKRLSPILAREFLLDFDFLLPLSEAVKFFASLFQKAG
jgi:hypothetical protein